MFATDIVDLSEATKHGGRCDLGVALITTSPVLCLNLRRMNQIPRKLKSYTWIDMFDN